MPAKKNQHYVPKCLLRRWAPPHQEYVRTVVLKSGKVIQQASIDGQCAHDYMYGKDLDVEDFFGKIESNAKPAFDFFESAMQPPTAWQNERVSLLMFILLQQARTEAASKEYFKVSEGMINKSFDESLPQEAKAFLDWLQDRENRIKFILSVVSRNLPLLFDLGIKLLCPNPGCEFVLGDNPCILFNQAFHRKPHQLPATGWAMSGLQVFMPISPSITIMLYDRKMYCIGHKKDGFRVTLNAEDTFALNSLQLLDSLKTFYVPTSMKDIDIKQLLGYAMPRRTAHRVRISSYNSNTVVGSAKSDLNIDVRWSFCRVPKKARMLTRPENWGPRDPEFVSLLLAAFPRKDPGQPILRERMWQLIQLQNQNWRPY